MKKRQIFILMLSVFTVTAFATRFLLSFQPPIMPYSHPHIQAPDYNAPKGCIVKKYHFNDEIDESCADYGYIFLDGAKYGLAMAKGAPYYRVGNDLISIGCFMGSCHTNISYKDSFYQ